MWMIIHLSRKPEVNSEVAGKPASCWSNEKLQYIPHAGQEVTYPPRSSVFLCEMDAKKKKIYFIL